MAYTRGKTIDGGGYVRYGHYQVLKLVANQVAVRWKAQRILSKFGQILDFSPDYNLLPR